MTCRKRIIPVVCRDVDFREVRRELAELNWIFFREDGDDYSQALKLLVKALDESMYMRVYDWFIGVFCECMSE